MPAADASPPPADARPLRVLLAEDDAPSQELALFRLRARGHDVTAVSNGREALDALARQTFDVVVLDVHMPVMGGVEALREMRRGEREGAHRRVIALTAGALAEEREKLLACGFDEVLTKPLQFEQLFRRVEAG